MFARRKNPGFKFDKFINQISDVKNDDIIALIQFFFLLKKNSSQ